MALRAAGDGMGVALLERERELAQIDAALNRAAAGDGVAVVFRGPPGIGKTLLLGELCGRAAERGMTVLSARGGESEQDLAFGVLRALFVDRIREAEPEAKLLAGAAALARPVLELGTGGYGRESSLESILHGLHSLCANLCACTPLVLAIDDAHWSDGGSLRFVGYLARRLEGLPLVLALSSRRVESAEPWVIDVVSAEPGAFLFEPPVLSDVAVGVLLRAHLGTRMGPEAASAVHAATGGNPFLVGEVIDSLFREGVATPEDAVLRVRELTPPRVRRAVVLRLARLSESAQRLARSIAVLAGGAAVAQAASLAELDEPAALQAITALVVASILEPGGRLEFAHPIIRRAVYADIPAAVRAGAHGRAARVLLDAGGSPQDVATHLLIAEPAGDQVAINVLRDAAGQAIAAGAPDSAVMYLQRALKEPPPRELRAELLYEVANAEVVLGAPTAIAHLREALAAAPDPARRAEIAIELVLMQGVCGPVDGLSELVEDALAGLTDPGHRELAERLESKLLFVLEPGSEAHAARLASLRAELDATKDGGRLALAHVCYDALRRCELDFGSVLAIAGRANAGGRLVAAGRTETLEKGLVGEAMLYSDRFAEITAWADEWHAQASAVGEQVVCGMQAAYRAQVAYRTGALLDAEADARAALDLEQAIGTRSRGSYISSSVLAKIALERGDRAEARRLLARVEDGSPLAIEFTAIESAVVRIAGGDVRGGVESLLALGASLEQQGLRNPSMQPWRSAAATGLSRLGEHAQARELAAAEVARARRFGAPRALGIALRVAGEIAAGDEALALLGEAAAVLERSGAKLERARTLVALGAFLRRSRSVRDARQPLRDGLDLAERCAAPALAARARDELLATGARPRRALLSGVEALTASERRIARMAADGMTNRNIAQSLFVTPKTVEMHLGNAYRKLGIHSRGELREPLAEPSKT